jgi:hypothetical protein
MNLYWNQQYVNHIIQCQQVRSKSIIQKFENEKFYNHKKITNQMSIQPQVTRMKSSAT